MVETTVVCATPEAIPQLSTDNCEGIIAYTYIQGKKRSVVPVRLTQPLEGFAEYWFQAEFRAGIATGFIQRITFEYPKALAKKMMIEPIKRTDIRLTKTNTDRLVVTHRISYTLNRTK